MCESTEPTNIIWENRHWTAADYAKRTFNVFIIIAGLILISFGMIFACKSFSIRLNNKYPNIQCDLVKKTYSAETDLNLYHSYIQKEYDGYYKQPKGKEPYPLTGPLQCYCGELKTAGVDVATVKLPGSDDLVCKQFNNDMWYSFVLSTMVQYMIIAINYVLRVFIIKLITYIGMDTESEQTRLICNGVFIV